MNGLFTAQILFKRMGQIMFVPWSVRIENGYMKRDITVFTLFSIVAPHSVLGCILILMY